MGLDERKTQMVPSPRKADFYNLEATQLRMSEHLTQIKK